MERLFLQKGEKVIYNNIECVIIRIIDANKVSIEELLSHIIHTIHPKELIPIADLGHSQEKLDLCSLSEADWSKAKKRYEIINPILSHNKRSLDLVSKIAFENNISVPTIYRWLKLYDESGLVSSLAGKKRMGGQGKSRLLRIQEDIINDKIHSIYLSSSKKSIVKTIREIELCCQDLNIKPPHSNTIRNRIKNIADETKIKKRLGIQVARYKFEPLKGKFPGADYPLAVVQIDHTPVDIILVDEQNRQPLKRPWLTLAMDVYSRMVVGFYLSFDTPGALGTGMCIANSILPKEAWLESLGVDSEWSCWGIMDKIHVDNAKEFRGKMLENACLNYGIDLEFRPIGSPHFGGHIERILGTFSKEIHNLPGTTFSSIQDRGKYDSKKNSSFTLLEFEKWLVTYITKIYHNRLHSGINSTPIKKFNDGILGTKDILGRGIPPRINNERKVRLDFMPYVERSIQEYGVLIDHIHYYSDVLRNYIHDTENSQKKKHIFKRDPRDISVIYFFDPKIGEYIDIPYRDLSLPPLSIWEYREVVKRLKQNKIQIDEKAIFDAYRELNEIERHVIRKTKNEKKREKIFTHSNEINPVEESTTNIEKITPFEDIDDEAFK